MKLMDKKDAASCLSQMASVGHDLELFVSEDICFADDTGGKWVSLGSVRFYPGSSESEYDIESAIRFGGFEWFIPDNEAINSSIDQSLPREVNSDLRKKIKKAFHEGLQDVVRRTHLALPVFDADTLSILPLRQPTTIVPDTSAVHQGALDFVCRFLTPWARVKVPAIVHMEIITNVDNYFKKVRFSSENTDKSKRRCTALRQHILSQGGQRTLLRIELTPEIELDRGDLGADPLRGIVTAASDPEDKKLGLQDVPRSFADRLILETARRFQVQVRPDHPLFILTSDQGMARMAMAEGMSVFFFQARSAPIVTGKTLTGTLHHPFLSEIYTVSLIDVLWELAVSFGQLLITGEGEDDKLELFGIGAASEGVTWQPLHARDDLIWGRCKLPELHNEKAGRPKKWPEEHAEQPKEEEIVAERAKETKGEALDLHGWYKFSLNNMLSLIGHIINSDSLNREQAQGLVGLAGKTFIKYERFLRSGNLVSAEGDCLVSTEKLVQLWQALTKSDTGSVQSVLKSVPSFEALFRYMSEKKMAAFDDPEIPAPQSVRPTYFILGEAVCAWLRVVDVGLVSTLGEPDPQEFARLAVATYSKLAESDDTEWVLTGKWLEHMATENSIHPMISKKLLTDARNGGIIQVFAEGSTPDTRFEDHHFWALFMKDDFPYAERVFLYHGNFILPGTSAVRIKIQDTQNAA